MSVDKASSMTRPLRAGVIGLGVGEQHVIAYNADPHTTTYAICDLDETRAQACAKDHNITKIYTQAEDLLCDDTLDVVSICSYDEFHADQVVMALENGKHVMVEKPVALHRHELERIIAAYQAQDLLLTSNLILRRSPRFIALKTLVTNGYFGNIFAIEGDYLHQILWKITQGWRGKMPFYCVTYGGGIHLIDLMRWLLGQEVVSVQAMGSDKICRDTSFPYPDCMINLLEFADGVLGKSMTSFAPKRPHLHRLNIFGTKAVYENGNNDAHLYADDDTVAPIRDK
ncbi:MAG: Gfo/Idh/MocA family oxidoreductase, partial [Pseudomonadota bacterium]